MLVSQAGQAQAAIFFDLCSADFHQKMLVLPRL
jgi:hypothetical protein